MDEYIEREAVLKFIEDGLNNPNKSKAFGYDAVCIMGEVRYMPAADVAPVVRCGECEKRDKGFVSEKGTISCPYMEAFMHKDDFCSYGERKDGE